MRLFITDQTAFSISIRFEDSGIAFVNSLRRVFLSEIPCIAFDLISIKDNTTVLADDQIVHRIGLIPIFHENNDMIFHNECFCNKFCEKCSFACELKSVNNGEKPLTVTSSDLIPITGQLNFTRDVPIVKIAPKQQIEILAIARKGVAKENAKWAIVNTVEYEYDPENKLRHTNYWFEENIEAEWPGVKESEMNPVSEVGPICIKVDTNHGNDISLIVKQGFDVLEQKIMTLRKLIVDSVSY